MKLKLLLIWTTEIVAFSIPRGASRGSHNAPIVKLHNGTFTGVNSAEYQQDFFIGIPYAQPPIGELRFRNPKSLNLNWSHARDATEYSPACVGYGLSQISYEVSEDCLYLNVILPVGCSTHDRLPVAVWIHGGGDLYKSVALGKPIIGVTLNYRLGAWGFLQGEDVLTSGDSNFGLRDQRLALHWINENIAEFGGDPQKVTIWGQSASTASVGLHITAYNGRDDQLFRSAIMESGGPVFVSDQNRNSYYNAACQNLTIAAGCDTNLYNLECLRKLPYETLNAILDTTAFSSIWMPQIDGDIIQRHSSQQLAPIIIGANSDEGTSFSPVGINDTIAFEEAVLQPTPAMNTSFARQILAAYPDDPSVEVLANLPPSFRPGPPESAQYRRAATYFSDETFIANRRLVCQTWAATGLTAYCYRFNAIPAWADQLDGATHFVEVAFAMLNLLGVGYPPVRVPPLQGKPRSYPDLANLVSSDWISFVSTGDVNDWKDRRSFSVLHWLKYDLGKPQNFVYDANVRQVIRRLIPGEKRVSTWEPCCLRTIVFI